MSIDCVAKIQNLPKSRIFFVCLIIFIISIAIASYLPFKIKSYSIQLFFIISILTFFSFFIKKPKIFRIILIWLTFLSLAFCRLALSAPSLNNSIQNYNNSKINFVGLILLYPEKRINNQKLVIKVEKVHKVNKAKNAASLNKVTGKVLILTNLYPSYKYGDKLQIICNLKAPKQFRDFEYDRFLAKSGIYSLCYYPQIKLISKNNGSSFYTFLYTVKSKLQKTINSKINEPYAGLARAIILGDKSGITSNMRDSFSKSGISHVVAISGMHISIISTLLMSILIYIGLKRKVAFIFASIFLVFYILLIGAPPSAVRAGFMGIIVLIALYIGRLNKISNALALAAAMLLIINPLLLRDDIGFQLSFLAVIGIVIFYPIFNNLFLEKIKKSSVVNRLPFILNRLMIISMQIVFVTLAAQSLVLPIIINNFKVFSLISPLTNLLVLWLLPFLMVLIIFALIISFFIPIVSTLIFTVVELMLKYIVWVSNSLTKFSFSFLEVNYLSNFWYLTYYTMLVGVCYMYCLYEKKTKKTCHNSIDFNN